MTDSNGDGAGTLTVLSAGAAALARATDLDTALAVIVEAGAAATGAVMAAVFVLDPERNGLDLLLTMGMAEDTVAGFEAEVIGNPDHPVHHAALDRTGTLSRVGQTPDGTTMTGADLPLVIAADGGVETCVGVLTFGWAGEHVAGNGEETVLVAVADLAAAAIAMFRTSSMAAERIEWLERVALTDPLTGLANARTVSRVLELEVARAARQGSEISVARVRRRRLPRAECRRPVPAPATRCCARLPRSSPKACAWLTRSLGPAVTSSCWSPPGPPGPPSRGASWTGSRSWRTWTVSP